MAEIDKVVQLYMNVIKDYAKTCSLFDVHIRMYLEDGITPETIIQENNRLIDMLCNVPDKDEMSANEMRKNLRKDLTEKVLRVYFPKKD